MSTPDGLPNVVSQTIFTETPAHVPLPNVSPEKLKTTLQGLVEELSEKIARSVNEARYGHLIDDSEEPVRQAGHEFLRAAFEAALQQKIDAAEASFPPSADDSDRSLHEAAGDQADAKQGTAGAACVDGERPRKAGAAVLQWWSPDGKPGSGGSGSRSGDGDDHGRRA